MPKKVLPPEVQPGDEGSIWLVSEPDENGTYRPSLVLGPDVQIFLDPDLCRLHAEYILIQVGRAEFDAKVYKQMDGILPPVKIGDSQRERLDTIGQIIQDLRMDRVEPESPTPFMLSPGVNRDGHPFLHVFVQDVPVGQWEMADARDHALACLELIYVTELDADYLRVLKGMVDLDDKTARRVVDALKDVEI